MHGAGRPAQMNGLFIWRSSSASYQG